MNSIDSANELLFETLTMLVEFHKKDIDLKQKEDIANIIENLEEVRSILYDLKNEIKSSVA